MRQKTGDDLGLSGMTANGRGSYRPVFSKENHSKPAAVIRQLDQKIAVGFGGKLLNVVSVSGQFKSVVYTN